MCSSSEGTNIRPDEDVEEQNPRSRRPTSSSPASTSSRSTSGMVLAMYSAQNIDRLVTLFRAAKRTGRTFVMTLYGASIAEATGNQNIPKAGWPQVRVFVPGWQQAKVKEAGAFERVDRIKPDRVFEEELAQGSVAMGGVLRHADGQAAGHRWMPHRRPRRVVDVARLPEGGQAEDAARASSRTEGSRSRSSTLRVTRRSPTCNDSPRRSSPDRVVPIHSFGWDRFDELFEGVEHHPDGEWWEV